MGNCSIFVLTLLAVSLVSAIPSAKIEEKSSNREPRYGIIKALLPYINLKIKTPFQCLTGKSYDGYPIQGTCMSSKDCASAGGTADGECAEGYGSCCVFSAACGETIERNRTYLISNGTYSSGSFSCQYTIKKLKAPSSKKSALLGACQVRLDFEDFVMDQPDSTNSLCSVDSFEVTGNENSFGKICGTNTGQHVYLPIGSSDTIATLILSGSSAATAGRNWRIKTTYIPCLSNETAPAGCLQYYNTPTDTIKSFNYLDSTDEAVVAQIGSLKYTICVGENSGSCGVTFTSSGTTSFSLTGDVATQTAATGADCTTDYLAVMTEAADGTISDVNKYCGTKLDPITTFARPFALRVRTDATEPDTDKGNKGFSFTYARQGCTTTG